MIASSASYRKPSALDALGEAVTHMRAKLFPFDFVGWITLAFVSLLESCGSGSGTSGIQNPPGLPGSGDDPSRVVEQGFGWIAAHMLIVVGVLMFIMVFSLLFMWLRSRTIFVYIDDVATGRFDLARPWSEHGAQADSFFGLSLVVQGAAFIVMVLILGLGGFFLVWAKTSGWATGIILLSAIPILFLFILSLVAAGVLNMALRDFVAPLQLIRNVGAREAGGIFVSMLMQSPGLLIGYTAVKFALSLVVGMVVMIGSCLTCCIGALPLVNQTLFQPIYYAERAWSLKLLAQMGEDIFGKMAPPSTPPPHLGGEDAPTEPIDLAQIQAEEARQDALVRETEPRP